MRKVKFLLLAALTAMFVGCQSDEVLEQDSGNDRPTPTGDTRITIEGEGMKDVTTRSSDGRVDFTGGYATGAGLYDGRKHVWVEAHHDAGYAVSYFYGGPSSEPKKYDYVQSGTSVFDVDLSGQDHTFHCGFKEKKRSLTVNAGSGGSVSPSGTNSYQVENAINITATPNTGYKFSGWIVTEGDATIANSGNSSTTATLHSSNSTITANFSMNSIDIYFHGKQSDGFDDMYISSNVILPFEVRLTAWQTIIEWDDRYDPPQETSYERTTTVTLKAGQKESDHNNFWLGVSNGGSWGWNIYVNGIEKINGDTYVYNGITYNIVVL